MSDPTKGELSHLESPHKIITQADDPILNFILTQSSTPAKKLEAPAPHASQLDLVFRAATHAPDHGAIRPWRFKVISGDGLQKLGDLFAQALHRREPDTSEDALSSAKAKALRAPMVILVYARLIKDHPKVPVVEQKLSCAMAVQNMLYALRALGFGGVLLTGANAYDAYVKKGLGLDESDEIIGFLYCGTPLQSPLKKKRADPAPLVQSWP